jgi:hypothetical protein
MKKSLSLRMLQCWRSWYDAEKAGDQSTMQMAETQFEFLLEMFVDERIDAARRVHADQ